MKTGDRLKYISGHNKRKYRSQNGLYRCYGCKHLFTADKITRERKRGHYLDSGWCGPCNTTRQMKWRSKNALHHKLTSATYGLAKYGMTISDYIAMYEQQNGRCAICMEERLSRLQPNVNREAVLHVDHCHSTGRVRGLLCTFCNHGIGRFKDESSRLMAAAEYLNRFNQQG